MQNSGTETKGHAIMSHYLTFVFADETGFGFTAPDIPGFTAHTETSDFDEAASEARTILATHIAAMIDAGIALPKARTLTELRADADLAEDWAEAETTMMLPALVPAGRTKRINVTMDENTLDLLDRAARERKITRSAALAEAAR
jgi:predicted RNase H-like HicB family nuclease